MWPWNCPAALEAPPPVLHRFVGQIVSMGAPGSTGSVFTSGD